MTWPQKASLRVRHLSKDQEMGEGPVQISGGRVGLANYLFGLSKNSSLSYEMFL